MKCVGRSKSSKRLSVSRGMGPGTTSPPYYNLVNVRLTNILKNSLQGRQVAVNIIESSDLHLSE